MLLQSIGVVVILISMFHFVYSRNTIVNLKRNRNLNATEKLKQLNLFIYLNVHLIKILHT